MKPWMMRLTLIACLLVTGCTGGGSDEEDDDTELPPKEVKDPRYDWNYDQGTRMLSSNYGKYKISLPRPPKRTVFDKHIESFQWSDPSMVLTVGAWPRVKPTDETVMADSCTAAVKRDNLKETARVKKSVPGGFEGFEVSGTTADGKYSFKMQQFFNDKTKTCYALFAKAPQARIDGPESTEFFKSLALKD
ncbi:MAG: hypothetical protein K2X93_07675 [Candidatus Obscuribacterales bacterium]|nr:hypothetical protein [Candidatus Obscuribacterales bacterium]